MPLNKIEAFLIGKFGVHRRLIKFVALWFADMMIFCASLPLALYIRLDFNPPPETLAQLSGYYFLLGGFCYTLTSAYMLTYSTIIRLANMNTALRISLASTMAAVAFYVLSYHVFNLGPVPRSIFLIQMLIFIPCATVCRFSFRLAERVSKLFDDGVPTIIYGAGRTAHIFLPALLKPASGIKVVGLVDDDRNKRRGEVQGVSVLGTGTDLEHLVQKHRIQQVIICMPSLDGTVLRQLIAKIRHLSVSVKIAPEANEYLHTKKVPEKVGLRDINIEDLLRRTPRKVDYAGIHEMIRDRSILVTGGGGSIGSELCRQIVGMNPRQLIVNDASEYNLYTILEELSEKYPECPVVPLLGDLSNAATCADIFRLHKIDIIFHAAAYKHVPLVESNINACIRNNIIGTHFLFENAWRGQVQKVVLVSSDKAVNPTNVMGASKRACEMIGLWHEQKNSRTEFSAVRFGNVLGSSGSVVPKFMKQIKSGGPVSITHPDITRYFMLIPEAVSLVLQAARSSSSGEIHVLDMGEPIKIIDLARDLFAIMGLQEGTDIDIVITGIRPGEKMFEELYLGHEELARVSADFFKVVGNEPIAPNFLARILEYAETLSTRSDAENRAILFDIIHQRPTDAIAPGKFLGPLGEYEESSKRVTKVELRN